MKHLGDITKINGAEIPIVDCITGGSPCQDLSVAGKRAGLSGERSGLFMEQLRIVKEMRKRDQEENGRTDQFIRPRFMVWENVPGAFSSNNGKDFQAVLTEIVRIVEPDAPDVPMPDKGKWTKSGCIYDEMGRWSIAWRVHDAQFWGVPQRRKRIALVADFGGLAAPEVQFERKSVSGDSEQSGTSREETAGAVGKSIESASTPFVTGTVIGFKPRNGAADRSLGFEQEKSPTINTDENYAVLCLNDQGMLQSVGVDTYNHKITGDIAATLNATSCASPTHSGPSVLILNDQGVDLYNQTLTGRIAKTVNNRATDSDHIPCVLQSEEPICIEMTSTKNTVVEDGISPTITARMGTGGNQVNAVYECFQNTGRGWWNESDIGATIRTSCGGDSVKANLVSNDCAVVRRLTPMECERLQGFPDGWTDIGEWTDSKGKKRETVDSARYKALGNSIALPYWFRLLRRISALYDRPATLGSLFDGISGFPLAWSRCNGSKTCLWSSEIEEFPIAVCKAHFGDDDNGEVGDIEKYIW